MSSMLTIGMRGLMAFQAALNVTSQNMTNYERPFYSRRQVEFAESMYNNGVQVSDVRRIYSEIASRNLQRATTDFSTSEIAYDQLAHLEKMLSNDKSGVGSAIKDTLKSIRELNNNVSSSQSRSNYLKSLGFLANRFNASASQVDQDQKNINQSLQTITNTVSQITAEIAALNERIANSQSEDISSILDKREEQVQELSKYIDFTSNIDSDNQLSITLSNGSALVIGNQFGTIKTIPDPADGNRLLLQLNTTIGVSPLEVTNMIKGGQIAGLYGLQTKLTDTQNALGRLALTFSNAINAQNKLGIDGNGNWGGNIFNDINNSNSINQRIYQNSNNTGTENMTVTITDTNQLTTSDYNLTFDTATHYSLTRKSDGVLVTSGSISSLPQQISADGFSININSGSIVAGDSFLVTPTKSEALGLRMSMTDPKLLALAWAVKTEPNLQNKGTGLIMVDAIIDPANSALSTPGKLSPPLRIDFLSNTTYQLVDSSTNTVIEGPITYTPTAGSNSIFPTPGGYDPGYTVSISGAVSQGDSFNIGYNDKMASDNRNSMSMEALYKKNLLQSSSMTFSDAFDLLTTTVSLQTRSERINLESFKALYDQASAGFQSLSGADPQEESNNLRRYYEGYQASAQIIQVAKSVFDTILQLGGR